VLKLSAQTHAANFYACAGWRVRGEVYEEAGIPHIAMCRLLAVDGEPCEQLD
jgi:predicted GNAT family N-acyltransferase